MDTAACLRNTYIYLFIGVIIAIGILWLYTRLNVPVIGNNIWAVLLLLGILIVLTIALSRTPSGPLKYALTVLWLLVICYLIYPLVKYLPQNDVIKYFIIALALFGLLTVIAHVFPPTFFLSWGKILMILLIIVIVIGVLGLFLFRNSRNFNLFYFILIIGLFSAFVLYDTQAIVKICQTNVKHDYINQSLGLFIDLVNIFAGVTGVSSI